MSQSTNDVLPAAINLALILKSETLLTALSEIKETLSDKSKETGAVIKMGRTHLNAASPIGLGQCFDAYASVLARDHERIKSVSEALRIIPLGGTVIGTGLNTTPEYRTHVIGYLRQVSGIDVEACSNLADGIQNTDQYAALSSALKICTLNLSKIASDLRLLGSDPQHGLGELILPPRQLGSSIITDKVNPVMAELINHVSFLVCGYDLTVSMAVQAGQLELNVYKPTIAYCLFRAVDMMTEAIRLFDKFCVRDLKAGGIHETKN
jgi:aspartate ammonia-lyase